MKIPTSYLLTATFVLLASCASQPPPAAPRRAEGVPPTAGTPSRQTAAASTDDREVADVLKVVKLEPVQAGKNVVVPMDIDAPKTGALTCPNACKRIVGDCLLETIAASGKISRQQIDRYRKSGLLDRIRIAATKSCQKSCAKPGTREHAKMQAMKHCAAKRTCTAVGVCAAKYLQ